MVTAVKKPQILHIEVGKNLLVHSYVNKSANL
jgi:hypothetical protein